MNEFDDVIKEFLVECYESLDGLDSDFVSLEENPNDRDRLASIFRTVHTIKGTSGFLAFPTLERVTHVGENLLVPLRDGKFELTHDMASSLLGMVDAIREILGNIEEGGGEGDETYDDLVAELESMLGKTPTAKKETTSVADAGTESPEKSDVDIEASTAADSDTEQEDLTESTQVRDTEENTSPEVEAPSSI